MLQKIRVALAVDYVKLCSSHNVCREPVWPSGKTLGWKQWDLGSKSASALLSLQKLWSVDTVLWMTRNIKMALIAAHLNAGVILVMSV